MFLIPRQVCRKAGAFEVYVEAFEVNCEVLDQLSSHFNALIHHLLHQPVRISSFSLCIRPLLYSRACLASSLGRGPEIRENLHIDHSGLDRVTGASALRWSSSDERSGAFLARSAMVLDSFPPAKPAIHTAFSQELCVHDDLIKIWKHTFSRGKERLKAVDGPIKN